MSAMSDGWGEPRQVWIVLVVMGGRGARGSARGWPRIASGVPGSGGALGGCEWGGVPWGGGEGGGGKGRWLTACVACLQDVERAAHVAFAETDEALNRVFVDGDAFLRDHAVDEVPDVGVFERAEAEARAAGEKGGGELVRVVGDDAEARVGRVFLHYAPQRHLRRRCHRVRFVQDYEFVRAQRGRAAGGWDRREDLFRA